MTQPLEIFDTPLDTINLVEASAGTGKTYAITSLYLRLVAELGLRVRDILVVTYTTAATEELRDRIRRRLVEVRRVFQQGTSDEAFCKDLLTRYGADRQRLIRRFNNAILAFDEAAIYTIHGFCQRALADSAFESGMPFETEILADQSEVLSQIVEDFWRRKLFAIRPLLAGHVIDKKLSPEKLRHAIQSYLGKPYLQLIGTDENEALAGAEEAFQQAFNTAQTLWLRHQEAITTLLSDQDALNARSYNKQALPGWFDAMDRYLGQDGPLQPRPFNKFGHFTTTKLCQASKKGKVPPQHEFFDACDALNIAFDRLKQYFTRYLHIMQHQLLQYCNTELPRRKRRHQLQSYDDLLLNLHAALGEPQRGTKLAESLRERYRAALIDEFQDTDPIQYAIFQTLYQGVEQPVFLVGDPKQAIYSFRGADIFAYLQAKCNAGGEYTLDTNWRSDPGLIKAINGLFRRHTEPFLLSEIPFHTVQAADRERPRLVAWDDSDAPLRIWFVERQEEGGVLPKEKTSELIARATAGRIARLLNQSEGERAYIEEEGQRRALGGGDIAVLVRNHRQADAIRRALLALGVPSVQQSRDSVFDTPEALELERLLLAIVTPRREDSVRAALVTAILGLSANALDQLLARDQDWEQELLEFNEYHQLWREQGFIRMFRTLLLRRDVYRRLLGFRDGERRLTNLLHLAELLQEISVNERLGMEGLVQWLAAQRADPSLDEERQQLRLESDANRVQIVTIHKSKGLEYPIVFCPFLWDAKLWSEKGDIIAYHDPDQDYRAVLDLGSAEQERHRATAIREELAENLRLAYVALTRAKYRCYTVWGAIKGAEKSALAWLLYRPPTRSPTKEPMEAHAEFVKVLNDAALWGELERLTKDTDGAVYSSPLPIDEVQPYEPRRVAEQVFSARIAPGQPKMGWRFTSFTALQQRRGAELPDYDAGSTVRAAQPEGGARNIFTFPQGARAGRCLHAILEQMDFAYTDEPLRLLTQKVLRKYGFETEWTEVVVQMVKHVLQVPLDDAGAVNLGRVGRSQRLTELEFMYRFEQLEMAGFQRIFERYGEDWATLLGNLDFRLFEGFMRGFIDLVFTVGGRVYLVDYKSNWLGPQRANYGQAALTNAMVAGGYHLQYLVYTVALHRYLKWRRPDYDYERHFGGVRYLFLRGMHPQHPDCGVFAARPPAGLIAELDAYLGAREMRLG